MTLPMSFAKFRNAKKAKISDNHFAILQKDVFRFQIFMDDPSSV